jgi:hypothetical protein
MKSRIGPGLASRVSGRGLRLAKLKVMLRRGPGRWMVVEVVLVCSSVLAGGQAPTPRRAINLVVVDENGLPVSGAEVTLSEPALSPMQCWTDFAGHCAFALQNDLPYQLRVEKQGFYDRPSLPRTTATFTRPVPLTGASASRESFPARSMPR